MRQNELIPCFCDVRSAGGSCLFVAEKPDHPFTKTLQAIAVTLSAKMSKAAEAKSKPMLLPQSARVFSPFSNRYTLPMNER